MSRKSIILALSFLALVALALAACTPTEVVKTVVVTQEVMVAGTPVVQNVVVTATPAPVVPTAAAPRTLVICEGQEPGTLYINQNAMLAKSQVLEAIYDGGGLAYDTNTFAYQPVITEKLASLADGDAVINAVDVVSGDRVVDDAGEPVELAAGVMVRPAGCSSADCAVAWDGTSALQMDQMVVTTQLLPGLLWSDGTPLTSADSLYEWNLLADPDTPSSKYLYDRTSSYETPDDVSMVWTGLPGYKDSTYFLNFAAPMPEHVWGQYTALELTTEIDAKALYTGYGPYILTEWVSGDHISMIKNPNYFRASEGLPKFDNVVYRFVGANSNSNIAKLLAGECDIVDQTASLDDQSQLLLELQAAGQLQATFVTGTTWEHADFDIRPLTGAGFSAIGSTMDGATVGHFGDVRLRQAVAMCMDRQAVVDTVTFGQSVVLDTYLPPNHPLFNPEAKHYDYDVTAASALLDEIGWKDTDNDPTTPRVASSVAGVPDGTLLEFTYETTNATMRQQATQILADSMTDCGIKVDLGYFTATEWFADGPDGKLFGRRFDLGQFAWLTGVEPPCDLYMTEYLSGPPDQVNPLTGKNYNSFGDSNDTGYSNPEYDTVCKAAKQSLPGQPAYDTNHLQAQVIFANDLPVVPLFVRIKLAATRPDMCNFIMDPTANSEFWNIENFDYGAGCK